MTKWIRAIALAAGLPACVSETYVPAALDGKPAAQAPAWMQYGEGPVPAAAARGLREYLGDQADAYPGCSPEEVLDGYTFEHSGHLLDACPGLTSTHIGCHKGNGKAGIISLALDVELGSAQGAYVLAHEALHAWLACTAGTQDPTHDSEHFCGLADHAAWSTPEAWACSE